MLPTYFISHGGGPWPYMPELRKTMAQLEKSLHDIRGELGAVPKAVLMISGHWEERDFSVMSNPHPSMEYDYSGFPEHTYHIKYQAPGSPALARRVQALIQGAGLPSSLNESKGFDHGAFAPMAVMYPDANMPLVQLAMKKSLDPAEHIALGRALRPLRDEGILIVGSGLSYHNLRMMGPAARAPSQAFDDWLRDALMTGSPERRVQQLTDWSQGPSARAAHPREDHLIPLMVAVGAAETAKATRAYHEKDVFGGMVASSYRFDD